MNHENARRDLISRSTQTRLAAARYLSTHAIPADVAALRSALVAETVPWVRRALEMALNRATVSAVGDIEGDDGDSLIGLDTSQIYAKACEEVAGSVVHEFSPLVGLLRVAVRKEIGDAYAGSQSERLLDQLQGLLRAIRELRRAAQAPSFSEFQVANLVSEVVVSLGGDASVEIHQSGPSDLVVSADRDQLRLAITNGLRNAVEAAREAKVPRVVVTWGFTANEFYLAIKDNGGGFAGEPRAAIKMGRTSKAGHIGFGLALAEQAIRSMHGELDLRSGSDGATFELRWYRDNENTVR